MSIDEEGNGTPLQYSCLENPMDREAWQAAIHEVAKSRTRLRDFTLTFQLILTLSMVHSKSHSGMIAFLQIRDQRNKNSMFHNTVRVSVQEVWIQSWFNCQLQHSTPLLQQLVRQNTSTYEKESKTLPQFTYFYFCSSEFISGFQIFILALFLT